MTKKKNKKRNGVVPSETCSTAEGANNGTSCDSKITSSPSRFETSNGLSMSNGTGRQSKGSRSQSYELNADRQVDEYITPQFTRVMSVSEVLEERNRTPMQTSKLKSPPNPGVSYAVVNEKAKSKPSRWDQQQLSYPQSGNNIVLISNSDDSYSTSGVPPSCVDNMDYSGSRNSKFTSDVSPEETLMVSDSEFDECDSSSKHGSWSFSPPTQVDERVDFFPPKISSVTSLSKTSKTDSSKYYYSGYTSQAPQSPDFSFSSMPPNTTDCRNLLDSLNYCQAKDCNSIASKKCAQCKNAFYCSEEHQKGDWKRHKSSCTSFRVQDVGEGAADGSGHVCVAVACRNIPAGEEIFSEKPILVFPLADACSNDQYTHPLDLPCVMATINNDTDSDYIKICNDRRPACLGCLRSVELIGTPKFHCQKCDLEMCSYNCQFMNEHQVGECEAMSPFGVKSEVPARCCHTLYMDVEILRALQLEKYDRLQWEHFLDMKRNVRVESYKKSSKFQLFAQHYDTLVPFSAKVSGYNRDLISEVHSIITSLSFRPSLSSSFKLLFSTQPLFAHDCVPNTFHYVEDEHLADKSRMKLVTKAATSIMKNEMIFIDFTPSPYLPYLTRTRFLTDILNIPNCLCKRCCEPHLQKDFTSEIKCTNCGQKNVRPEEPRDWQNSVWSCRSCQEETPYAHIEKVTAEGREKLAHSLQSVNMLLDFIMGFGTSNFHDHHHLMIMAWCYIESKIRKRLAICRSIDPTHIYTDSEIADFKIMGQYVDVMLSHMDSIRPGLWVDKGILLFHKFYCTFVLSCKACMDKQISKKQFSQRLIKALKILQQSLATLAVYEGYNAPAVVSLTQEATSALASLKEYYQLLINQSLDDELLPPLRNIYDKL